MVELDYTTGASLELMIEDRLGSKEGLLLLHRLLIQLASQSIEESLIQLLQAKESRRHGRWNWLLAPFFLSLLYDRSLSRAPRKEKS